MPDQDLNQMEQSAVDLDQARVAREASDEARLTAAQRQAEQQVASWDRAMTRAFKGILPAPERRRMRHKAVENV